jgi:hypothetical protein
MATNFKQFDRSLEDLRDEAIPYLLTSCELYGNNTRS